MIDDPNSKRWADSTLDRITSRTIDDLWSDILDVAPYIVSQYQQISTLHTPGYIDLKVTDFGGDLIQRFYRLQQVVANGRQYTAKDPRDYLMSAASNTGDTSTVSATVEQAFTYQFLGDQLWLHPLGQVTTFTEIRYNYRPIEYTKMTDGLPVAIPEGSDAIITLQTAAQSLPKGNAEDAEQFRQMAAEAKQSLLNSIRRQYHGATQMYVGDSSVSFGGI